MSITTLYAFGIGVAIGIMLISGLVILLQRRERAAGEFLAHRDEWGGR